MDIITNIPKSFTDGEVDQAFLNEIKSGFQLEKETEHLRVAQARKQAAEERGKTHPVLGKCVATMPAREFFRLTKKYGHEEVHSKEFYNTIIKNLKTFHPIISNNGNVSNRHIYKSQREIQINSGLTIVGDNR